MRYFRQWQFTTWRRRPPPRRPSRLLGAISWRRADAAWAKRALAACGGLVIAAVLAGSGGLPAYAQSAQETPRDYGVWRNPNDTVHVQILSCGSEACGYVIWAADEAKEDARRGGTPDLVGLQLFRDFRIRRDGVWSGKVFVPDLNRTFSGTAQLEDQSRMRLKGCLLIGLICKSQTWTRVDIAPPQSR